MRIPWKAIGLSGLAIVLGIQLVRPDRTNPPVDASHGIEANLDVPADVRAIFERSCRDCHTHRTTWPWYSQVAPVSWLVAGHVRDGRRFLDLDEWTKYDANKSRAKLDQICENVSSGHMPIASYRPMHPGAKLSRGDVRTICEWTRRTIDASVRAGPGGG